MSNLLLMSENVLKELTAQVAAGKPALSSERGELFMLPDLPVGTVKLKTDLDAYEQFLKKENGDKKMPFVIPYPHENFHVIINTQVSVRDGKTFVNETEYRLL